MALPKVIPRQFCTVYLPKEVLSDLLEEASKHSRILLTDGKRGIEIAIPPAWEDMP